jgi:hypothetical protein
LRDSESLVRVVGKCGGIASRPALARLDTMCE